jgi:hypothetical protein
MISTETKVVFENLTPAERIEVRRFYMILVVFGALLVGAVDSAAVSPKVNWKWIPIVQTAIIFAPVCVLLVTRANVLRFLCGTEFGKAKEYDPDQVGLLSWHLVTSASGSTDNGNGVRGVRRAWASPRLGRAMQGVVACSIAAGLSVLLRGLAPVILWLSLLALLVAPIVGFAQRSDPHDHTPR